MQRQQELSRATSKMTGDVFTNTALGAGGWPKTEFCGYEQTSCTGNVLQFFVGNEKTDKVRQEDKVKVILDKTPFYAESGGQVGDSGYITCGSNRIRISDTQKTNEIFIHNGVVEEGVFTVNDSVTATIDQNRRLSIMRNHTATHLLQAALRHVLGPHIQQQGSLVAEDRLRFDFTHHKQVSLEQLVRIEEYVNRLVLACDAGHTENLPIKKAKQSGGPGFFCREIRGHCPHRNLRGLF